MSDLSRDSRNTVKRATQQDVARLAGVSTATVSRVVNDRGVVTVEARQRVEKAIEDLQYVPHASARTLATQQTHTLGAIIPTLNNAIFAEGMNAFERCAEALGYTLLLAVSHQDLQHEKKLVLRMIERGVDGLLLIGNQHDPAVFERLHQANLRSVCAWSFDEAAELSNVGFDNAEAMHAVIDHLVELGHRQFGMIAGLTHDNDRAAGRLAGTRARLAYHGLTLPDRCVVEVPYAIDKARRALWDVLDNDVTAVVCGNDVIAYGALLEAKKMGLQIPEQLSLTGFDDLNLSADWEPSLTTVAVGADVMGAAAARRLVQAIESQTTVSSQRLKTRLIVRETTAPPTLQNPELTS